MADTSKLVANSSEQLQWGFASQQMYSAVFAIRAPHMMPSIIVKPNPCRRQGLLIARHHAGTQWCNVIGRRAREDASKKPKSFVALRDVAGERTGVEPIDEHVGPLREWVRQSVPRVSNFRCSARSWILHTNRVGPRYDFRSGRLHQALAIQTHAHTNVPHDCTVLGNLTSPRATTTHNRRRRSSPTQPRVCELLHSGALHLPRAPWRPSRTMRTPRGPAP